MRTTSPARLFAIGHFLLCAGLLWCLAVLPEFFLSPAGVSNFGVYSATILPYSVAVAGCAWLSWLAAKNIQPTSDTKKELVLGTKIYAVLLLAMLLSTYPYQLSVVFDAIHRFIGTVLVLWMLGFGWWLALHYPALHRWGLLAGIFVGSLISYLSVVGVLASLFAGQVLTAFVFGVLIWSVGRNYEAIT